MVSPKKALTFTTYYHMVFFVALSFFTDKLAGQYKVGEAAENPHVLAMMKVVGASMFGCALSSGIAARLEDERLMSNAAFANVLYHAGFVLICYFDLQDFKTMGIDVSGIYFNVLLNAGFAYLNYQAWKDTGSQRDDPLPLKGQSPMVTCLRINSAMGVIFGLWALFSYDSFIQQYFKNAPSSGNEAIMLKLITRTFAFNAISTLFKNGALIVSENEDGWYGGVRGAAMYWLFCCGMLSQDSFLEHWKPEAHTMNVVMQFGMAFYAMKTMLNDDIEKAKED